MKNARKEIVNILNNVIYENAYASLLMRNVLNEYDERDRRFISEVVYGTLRNYSLLELQWKPFAKKVKKKTALILNMSIYQLFFMETENYAIVNEAVNLVNEHEKGFINAILHKVLEKGIVQPDDDSLESIAIKTSHPLWLLKMWKAHYGEKQAISIANANQDRPIVYGRINTLKITKEELEKDDEIHFLNDLSFTYDGILSSSELFQSGKVLIQDIHSALVPTYLDVKPGMMILDACAAPGTKTQEIAMLMNNKGHIEAGELYEHRTQLIIDLMKKTNVTIVKPVVRDAKKKEPYENETFDRILLDVPCSGLGDLRHKPEIRYTITPEKLDEIVEIQSQILNANAELLKVGGILVYSTCTLNRKENENQIKKFLTEHENFELLQEKTLFPFEETGDGFYFAKLLKK